jgi:type IV pilus assembly protein PilC
LGQEASPVPALSGQPSKRQGKELPPPKRTKIGDRGRKVALFCRYLAVLLGSGVTLTQALDILVEQTEDPAFAEIVEEISRAVQSGHTLSHALRRYSQVFPTFFVGLVAAGENSGTLIDCVRRCADVLEGSETLSKSIQGALAYPLFVLGLTALLTLTLFKTVLPQFAEMFAGVGVTLPLPTRIVLGLTYLVGQWWAWLLAVSLLAGAFWALRKAWANPSQRLLIYRGLRRVPLLGDILKYGTLARFCWVMQLTLSSGMDVLRSYPLAAEASNCPMLQADLPLAVRSIREGQAVSEHMRAQRSCYPPVLAQMALLSEEASEYSEAFRRSAQWFEQEVEVRIELFKAALEPVLMGMVSIIVGSIMLSIFLPLYGILDKLEG